MGAQERGAPPQVRKLHIAEGQSPLSPVLPTPLLWNPGDKEDSRPRPCLGAKTGLVGQRQGGPGPSGVSGYRRTVAR